MTFEVNVTMELLISESTAIMTEPRLLSLTGLPSKNSQLILDDKQPNQYEIKAII